MKKRILHVSTAIVMLAASFSVSAQELDITPAKFRISELPVGNTSLVEQVYKGQALVADVNPATGRISMSFAPPKFDAKEHEGLLPGIQIVNSEFGKLMMVKGINSTETLGTNATGSVTGWWNLDFWTHKTAYPVNTKVRLCCIVKAVPAKTMTLDLAYAGGVPFVTAKELYIDSDTQWYKTEVDIPGIEDIAAKVPIRIKIAYKDAAGSTNGGAMYIANISLTANPEGEVNPDGEELQTPTGLESALAGDDMFLTWDDSNIYVNNAAEGEMISVYSINGSLVKTVKAESAFVEIPMIKGTYVVKAGEKSVVVIL